MALIRSSKAVTPDMSGLKMTALTVTNNSVSVPIGTPVMITTPYSSPDSVTGMTVQTQTSGGNLYIYYGIASATTVSCTSITAAYTFEF